MDINFNYFDVIFSTSDFKQIKYVKLSEYVSQWTILIKIQKTNNQLVLFKTISSYETRTQKVIHLKLNVKNTHKHIINIKVTDKPTSSIILGKQPYRINATLWSHYIFNINTSVVNVNNRFREYVLTNVQDKKHLYMKLRKQMMQYCNNFTDVSIFK